MDRLIFNARVRLLSTEQGGRRSFIRNDYRPSWNLGNTWFGEPSINDGRVLLDPGVEIHPGAEATIKIEPLAWEFWGRVRIGSILPMQEGSRVVGHATVLGVASAPEFFGPDVCSFVDQTHQFCRFIENAGEYAMPSRLGTAEVRLAELYRAATTLPVIEPPSGFDAGPSPERPKGWPGFERFEHYWKVFDPYEEAEPVACSLSDDFLDIYADVRRGLILWEKRVPRAAPLWEWRFHFDHHWGNHAVGALSALHHAGRRT